MDAPPLSQLPHWGPRIEFAHFFVELVPPGERIFNVRLTDTFASINFAPAEGTSSMAGDRLRRYERRPYEFIVAPPKFPLSGETTEAPEVLAFVIQFEAMRETLAEALGVSSDRIGPEIVIGDPSSFTTMLANKVRQQFATTIPPHIYLESLCLALLVEMFRPILARSERKQRQKVDEKKIDLLLKYIDANIDSDLAIDHLAGFVGVSSDQLNRSFKSAIGEAPHTYVIKRRTDAARKLLLDASYSLADIAYATGFSSQSHMTSSFKKVLGTTPGAVRRQG